MLGSWRSLGIFVALLVLDRSFLRINGVEVECLFLPVLRGVGFGSKAAGETGLPTPKRSSPVFFCIIYL